MDEHDYELDEVTKAMDMAQKEECFRTLKLPSGHVYKDNYFATNPLPPIDWLVDGLLTRGDLVMLTAEPETGKSWLTQHLALSLATGKPFLDKFAIPHMAASVILDGENHIIEVWRRVQRLQLGYNYSTQDMANCVHVLPHTLVIGTPEWDAFEEWITALFALSDDPNGNLLVLDSLTRFHRVNENSSGEMSGVMDKLKQLAKRAHCAIVFVHHSRKASKDRDGRVVIDASSQAPRGSSDLRAVVDQHWYLAKVSDNRMNFYHDKHRTGPKRLDSFDIILEDTSNGGTLLKTALPTGGVGGAKGSPKRDAAVAGVKAGIAAGLNSKEIHAKLLTEGWDGSYIYVAKMVAEFKAAEAVE